MRQSQMPTCWTTCPHADSLVEIIYLIVYRTHLERVCLCSNDSPRANRTQTRTATKIKSFGSHFERSHKTNSGTSETAGDKVSIHQGWRTGIWGLIQFEKLREFPPQASRAQKLRLWPIWQRADAVPVPGFASIRGVVFSRESN